MLGIFASLKIFSPERQEESWDPQHMPQQAGIPYHSLTEESTENTPAIHPGSKFVHPFPLTR